MERIGPARTAAARRAIDGVIGGAHRRPVGLVHVLAITALQLALPAPARSQASEADSLAALEEALETQARYERFRVQNIVPQFADLSERCDDNVGRFCFRFQPHAPGLFEVPDLGPRYEMAQVRTVRELGRIARTIPGDRWLMAVRVHYYLEMGVLGEASVIAADCPGPEWWCLVLQGTVQHHDGAWEEAGELFDRALAAMPPDTARAWATPEYVLDRGADEAFEDGDEDMDERLWLLSDPLYLMPGNDRRTEHFARMVTVRALSRGENGTGLPYAEDLEEVTLQWGVPRAWTRERGRPSMDPESFLPTTARDTSKIVRHHWGTDFLPNEAALRDPAELRPGDWEVPQAQRLELRENEETRNRLGAFSNGANNGGNLAPQITTIDPEEFSAIIGDMVRVEGPRTGYQPPYARTFETLHRQVARFRRGDSLLVVAAHAPAPDRPVPTADDGSRSSFDNLSAGPLGRPPTQGLDLREARNVSRTERQQSMRNPFASVEEEIPEPFMEEPDPVFRSGLFLIPTEMAPGAADALQARHDQQVGSLQLLAPNGRYLLGLETLDETSRKAWRARQGVWQDPLPSGLAALSDLLVLEAEGDLPESLEEAMPQMKADLRVRTGDSFRIAWELYGILVGETAEVRLGITDASPGVISRLGQFLRLINPDDPVVTTWEDAGPDVLGTVFRSVEIRIPELDPGPYDITIEVEIQGREPMRVGRRIQVVG